MVEYRKVFGVNGGIDADATEGATSGRISTSPSRDDDLLVVNALALVASTTAVDDATPAPVDDVEASFVLLVLLIVAVVVVLVVFVFVFAFAFVGGDDMVSEVVGASFVCVARLRRRVPVAGAVTVR